MFVDFEHFILNFLFFFFNDTATTEIYTLSLHDALPIYRSATRPTPPPVAAVHAPQRNWATTIDRKSTRLNSSHGYISYAVFCLKKKSLPHFSALLATHEPGLRT